MTHIEEVKDLILSKMAALLSQEKTDVIELGRLAEIYRIIIPESRERPTAPVKYVDRCC